ncbi:RapGAP/RanGAP domain-containing protein [Tieghemostelium lacteum]|uniref:RapGAP/RanGAP domain-containing protein n=1 Tax=Tieghemostelium lacteum TaxID=361077 RepID=A0A151Z6J2_TIELA|nr:RapGAP/RanGAP domain-containing protein [Tieghemostelium lacteum]|eukprot:KYQ89404.1 RapGAP/RanGAP domain-containing protein [Tieghemostelium lacteum]
MVLKGLIKGSVNWKVENGIDEVIQQQQMFAQALSQSSQDKLQQSMQNHLILQQQHIGMGIQYSSSGSLDFETPAVENPEECVLWYYNYFLGKSHSNYLGVDDSGSVFGASIIKEESDYGDISYKTIVWTSEGIERQWIQLKQKQSSMTPNEIIKRTAPKLSIKKMKEIDSLEILQDFKDLEASQTELNYKFGILLATPGQATEDQFYNNQQGSEKWNEFLNLLGERVELRSFKGYRGGLDVVNNTTGSHSLYTKHKGYEIMFHVSTMLPYTPGDTQQIERKRHIGNDIVIVIFYDGEDDIIPWDPSTVNSNFNHIFAVIRPDGDNYHLEFAVKNSIARFGPKLPNPSLFPKTEAFTDFFITKLVNAQRAALQSAPSFTSKLKRTFKAQLELIYQRHQAPSTASLTSFVTKRRSNSISHINKGKELKAKEQIKYSSSFIKYKGNLFDTEILFSKNLSEKIVCLDIFETDDIRSTLVVATEESIYVLKSNIITNESIFQKVIQLKDINRITVIKPLGVLLVLTPKGLFYYSMDQVMNCFKISQYSQGNNSSNYNSNNGNSNINNNGSVPSSPPSNSILSQLSGSNGGNSPTHQSVRSSMMIVDEPKPKFINGTKGCNVYGFTKADAQNANETDITLLYVAIKKTLNLYEWNKGEFQKNRDLPVNENIKALCPVAPGMICIGVAKEFLLVDIFTQTIKELYKKPNSEPVKALQLDSEILLCFNNIGIFVDEKGNKTRSYELKWGSTPSSLALVPSYILGISGPLIEVRSLLNGNIIQSLPSDVNTIEENNSAAQGNSGISGILNFENQVNGLNINHSSSNIAISSLNTTGSDSPSQLTNSHDETVDNHSSSSSDNNSFSTFSIFNDINMSHENGGNIFVASSSKGVSRIIRIRQNLNQNPVFSPPSSPSISVATSPPKDLSLLTIHDLSK